MPVIKINSKGKQKKSQKKNLSLLENNLDSEKVNVIKEKRNELEKIRNKKIRGSYIRSRAKWIEEGEKPSKYICNLESKNFINKQISKLELENGQILQWKKS